VAAGGNPFDGVPGAAHRLWVRDGRRFVNVRSVLPDTSLQGVRIYEFDERAALVSISEARPASMRRVGRLAPAQRRADPLSGRPHRYAGAARPGLEVRADARSAVGADGGAGAHVGVDLYSYIRHLEENNQRTTRYEIALWKKLAYPFAALVMMGLALPLATCRRAWAG
jgi:lipopolysaccharide export system permease protein